eukprot:GHVR01058213.1.p1 GENE.GHVR01058213.1~~GHVR01058213.1.p1  ORF type:complete len:840 (+),score=172.80 GHVR01058213.1:431-2950(+)
MSNMIYCFMSICVLIARLVQLAFFTPSLPKSCIVCEMKIFQNINIFNKNILSKNILLMGENLSKAGVYIEEIKNGIVFLPSGPPDTCPLQYLGSPTQQVPPTHTPCVVKCEGVAEVAMGMSLLCAVRSHIYIPEWRCVEKLFPDFWDILSRELGVVFEGCDKRVDEQMDRGSFAHGQTAKTSNIVVIGMRNIGKTKLGGVAAQHLERLCGHKSWVFEDLDEKFNFDIASFVEHRGWEAFRREEAALLRSRLVADRTEVFGEVSQNTVRGVNTPVVRAIVACGGGVVEAPGAVSILSRHPCVVWLRLNDEDAVNNNIVNAPSSKPAYGEDVATVYARRKTLYEQVSNFEFVSPKRSSFKNNNEYWEAVETAFVRFIACLAIGPPPVLRGSTFVSFPYSNYTNVSKSTINKIALASDAVEFRLDLLDPSVATAPELGVQFFHLRSATSRPIIATYRSTVEGGKGSDSDELALSMLSSAFRYGVEWIDVEVRLAESTRMSLKNKLPAHTEVILSRHVISSPNVPPACEITDNLMRLCSEATLPSEVVKLVYKASVSEDCTRLLAALDGLLQKPPCSSKHVICFAMGIAGKLSRVVNSPLSPVTSELLPAAVVPCQLSAEKLHSLRVELGLPCAQLFVCGTPISKSASPAFHNAVIRQRGLPFEYSRFETDKLIDVAGVFASPVFGGMSVTVPLKESVVYLCDKLTPAAQAIGAVNTVYRDGEGLLCGANTDYLAIQKAISFSTQNTPETERRQVKQRRSSQRSDVPLLYDGNALVLGAGGAARAAVYAAKQMNFNVFIWNRTKDKAEALAAEMSASSMWSIPTHPPFNVIVSSHIIRKYEYE